MELEVKKVKGMKGTVRAPSSKSYTHRAFIIASLAEGTSQIKYPLYSEDTLASADACRAFGSKIRVLEEECLIEGCGGRLKTPKNVLDVKNSGTTLRIMTSVAALAPQYTVITGDDSLRQRPMEDLLQSLQKLGVTAFSTRSNGMPPIVIKGGFKGGISDIKGNISSQFISSILIASPYAERTVDIQVRGDFISKPYVDITREVMQDFGVSVDYHPSSNSFQVEPQKYRSTEYTVEGDYSSASYVVAAAATLPSEVTIENLSSRSLQGDRMILDIVRKMGCEVKVKKDEIKISGSGEINGTEVDLGNAPDLLPTVAALGALAQGTTRINGVEHARYKETDRIHACALELSKLGVSVKEEKDGLIISGGVRGGVVDSHLDHRLAMAFYIIGLKVGKVKIQNASVYQVSFPGFPEVMGKLAAGWEHD